MVGFVFTMCTKKKNYIFALVTTVATVTLYVDFFITVVNILLILNCSETVLTVVQLF